jgi:hypothetical protein
VAACAAGVYLVAEPPPLPIDEEKLRACAYPVDGDVIGCKDQTQASCARSSRSQF